MQEQKPARPAISLRALQSQGRTSLATYSRKESRSFKLQLDGEIDGNNKSEPDNSNDCAPSAGCPLKEILIPMQQFPDKANNRYGATDDAWSQDLFPDA